MTTGVATCYWYWLVITVITADIDHCKTSVMTLVDNADGRFSDFNRLSQYINVAQPVGAISSLTLAVINASTHYA